ncbi:hypothetical protein OHA37_33750 [Streptomyces sp. NBC_00335]|uniref:hypothetical protein n=1 Tax=unclassified Streptomyces TaxID=2593676 RepID=UPI002259F9AF|nr:MULTISPECIES: hypothetical protein [unclassified Streptomyces]MCX5408807.1 hypothetical protein [Streptomyces sp. NBC_00086]
MITARAASGAKRARRPAGALRLLWLAALLFAFLYTHAAGADSASAHVARGAVPVAHLDAIVDGSAGVGDRGDSADPHGAEAPRGHDDGGGGGHDHPAEACVSGHPQQGAELPEPALVPLGDPSPAVAALRPGSWAPTVPCGLPPLRSVLGSVVQQV